MVTEQLPPFSSDAEESVLGAIMIDNEALDRLTGLLKPADFFREQNQWCWEGMLALYSRNEAVNQITLADELKRTGRFDDVGQYAYLSHVVSVVPTSLHAEHYGRIVKRTSLMRQLVGVAGQIAQLGYQDTADAGATLAKAEDLLGQLRQEEPGEGFVSLRRAVEEFVEATLMGREGLGRIATGFTALDDLLGGLHGTDLIVLAARPGLGKTSLLLNIAEHAARQGKRVGVFSLEMAREQLVQRFVGGRAGVDLQRLRLGHLGEAEQRRVLEAVGELSELPLMVDDSPLLTVGQIRSEAKRLASQHGLDLVALDYLQLANGTGRKESRQEEVNEIAKGLKALARELRVPVLAAAQLSRAVEQRPDHRPMLSDLRESGAIEQVADVVAFIYREEVYTSEDEWQQKRPGQPYPKGIAEIIVAKHRNGPTGQCRLMWLENLTKFGNLDCYRQEPTQQYGDRWDLRG